MSHFKRHRGSFDKSEAKGYCHRSGSNSVSTTASTKIESLRHNESNTVETSAITDAAARHLMRIALRLYQDKDGCSSSSSSSSRDLGLLSALLQRCAELDARATTTTGGCGGGTTNRADWELQRQLAECTTHWRDSGYRALHQAIYGGDLGRILLWLRHASGGAPRMTRRPMELLYQTNNTGYGSNTVGGGGEAGSLLTDLLAVDHEGLTPAVLLAVLQRPHLAACRVSLTRHTVQRSTNSDDTTGRRRCRSRSNSLFDELAEDQDEFHELSHALQQRQVQQRRHDSDSSTEHETSDHPNRDATSRVTYGCEVLTFGRAHHCALGVVASNRTKAIMSSGDLVSCDHPTKQQHPQRVQAFALDTVGRGGSAVAVASATYHTLTVTARGELYAFGLGKGGRLGTGNEKPCATPVRVTGALSKQRVVGVAAAENHSLCVTAAGHVYAFGSNRFGQLGTASGHGKANNSDDISLRSLPRRVQDLKHVACTSVAAGAGHSVALSRSGEVYVWGDNSAGQLGIYSRSSSDTTHIKPQRVEALWKPTHGSAKIALAIAASDASTLVLTSSSGQKGLAHNMVYSWGNGNHVPTKAQFGSNNEATRAINPIAISCAKYHNVVVTEEGEVYSWGLHADSLGTSGRSGRSRSSSDADKNHRSSASMISSPQLVRGVLPEQGGGRVVAASTSENHTAVITEDGHLWTWGETHQQNVLGHEGVRWQPVPKRVPGVHRAVAVSAAKEHTVLLIGTAFPPLPCQANSECVVPTLETVAARTIAQHVDLFNIFPILITAERTQTSLLLDYCKEFVKLNCDGILNVSQKSAMDCYLNEQLDGCSVDSATHDEHRDGQHHPFLTDLVLAGSRGRLAFGRARLCGVEHWLAACQQLSKDTAIASALARATISERAASTKNFIKRRLSAEVSVSATKSRPRNDSFSAERCDELTTNMDLSSKEFAEAKLTVLVKEVRGVRKRLNQIAKLESSRHGGSPLTDEQQLKAARRPQLAADLVKLESAIVTVKDSLHKIFFLSAKAELDECEEAPMTSSCDESGPVQPVETGDNIEPPPRILRCDICQITCPDEKSHELHMNGRKHRNRVMQVEEEEKKQAAATMVEEQRRNMLLQSEGPVANVHHVKSPWGQKDVTVNPKYTLPPPPLPIADTLASPRSTAVKKSLRDIMAEEARQTSVASKPSPMLNKCMLQLPPGSAPPLKSPPWATAKSDKVVLQLPPGSAPPLKSPPWATARAVEALPARVPSPTAQHAGLMLGDFIDQKPAPRVVPASTPRPSVGWVTPKAKAPSEELSFLAIQQQELEFKSKEDQTFSPNGKWFIGRRERAGSLKEIQCETFKQTEEEQLIQEQIAIEKQILEDLARKQASNPQTTPKRRCKPKKGGHTGQNNSRKKQGAK
jgi:inhibitor of Bruton tyrosine kinase